jgi:hypothetical protein
MRTASARRRHLRDWGLRQVSSGTGWIVGAAVVATGAVSAAFALPQLLDKAQAQPQPATSTPADPLPGVESPDAGAGSGLPSSPPTTNRSSASSSSSSSGLTAPQAAPASPRRRSHAVTGAS